MIDRFGILLDGCMLFFLTIITETIRPATNSLQDKRRLDTEDL
jgi:hypothetical protein